MSINIDFAGFDELQADLERLAQDGLDEIEANALKAGAEVIKKHQEDNWNRSDVDQDHIADNTRVGRVYGVSDGSKIVVDPIGRLRWRGMFVEWGTSRGITSAMPVQKSLEQGRSQATQLMMREYERVVDRF